VPGNIGTALGLLLAALALLADPTQEPTRHVAGPAPPRREEKPGGALIGHQYARARSPAVVRSPRPSAPR